MKKDKWIIFLISFLIPLVLCWSLKCRFEKISYDVCAFEGIEVIKTFLGVWSTLLGFIITAASILLTMGGKEYLQAFKSSKHYGTVLYTYALTSFILLGATVFGMLVVCINEWNAFLFYALIYLIASSLLLLLLSISFLFFMIFKAI